MELRAPYNYDADKVSVSTGIEFPEPSLTIQSQAAETDINLIIKKYSQTGAIPQVNMPPTFGDFSQITDFHEAQQLIRQAEESFMSLPPEVRQRFEHDPGLFVQFASDPENLPELRKLGLAPPAPPASPQPAPPV